MKNINKIDLGKRLIQYFKKCRCEVQITDRVQSLDNPDGERSPTILIYKISAFETGKFQQRRDIISYTGYYNDSYDKLMREFVDYYCGSRWSRGFTSNEFISAASVEELDLKLSMRGF